MADDAFTWGGIGVLESRFYVYIFVALPELVDYGPIYINLSFVLEQTKD